MVLTTGRLAELERDLKMPALTLRTSWMRLAVIAAMTLSLGACANKEASPESRIYKVA